MSQSYAEDRAVETVPAIGPKSVEPVLIVGAGTAGLSAALELARCGVRSIVLEQRIEAVDHPRTRVFVTLSLEIARGWGPVVYRRLVGIDTLPGWKSPIRFLTSAVRDELGRIETTGFEGAGPDVSPATAIVSSQELVEQIQLDAAYASGLIEIRLGHRVEAVLRGGEEDAEDAAVRVLDTTTGDVFELSGSALIGADGVDSRVRRDLDIELRGKRNIAHFINIYFLSDLEARLGDRPGILFFVNNERAEGVLQPLDARGRWLSQITVPESQWNDDYFGFYTREYCEQWIRDASGVEDLQPEIRSIGRWRMNSTLADRLLSGRIVLCGDAAHQCPPTGGMGVNTGIRGANNVAWKLAMFVSGRAGYELLRTYEDEHRPVVERTNEQCYENYTHVKMMARAALDPSFEHDLSPEEIATAARRYGNQFGIEFGAAYESSAVIEDGTPLPAVEDSYSDYVPSGRPGCRAPHVWLGRGDARLSTRDLISCGFVVLAGPDGGRWEEAVETARRAFDFPLTCYVIDRPGLEDRDGVFLERYGLPADGAVLVRPDGYIAWRCAHGSAPDAETLISILEHVLSVRRSRIKAVGPSGT